MQPNWSCGRSLAIENTKNSRLKFLLISFSSNASEISATTVEGCNMAANETKFLEIGVVFRPHTFETSSLFLSIQYCYVCRRSFSPRVAANVFPIKKLASFLIKITQKCFSRNVSETVRSSANPTLVPIGLTFAPENYISLLIPDAGEHFDEETVKGSFDFRHSSCFFPLW